jgi:hypothetical protein
VSHGAGVHRTAAPRWRAIVLLVAYVAAARGVGNLYPLSTFEMYGGTRLTTASRIAVIDADGVHEVERFSRWRCAATVDVDPRHCPQQWPYFHVEARDREVLAHIERAAKPGADARDVTVFRRVWRAADDGPMVASDCELARCEAAP